MKNPFNFQAILQSRKFSLCFILFLLFLLQNETGARHLSLQGGREGQKISDDAITIEALPEPTQSLSTQLQDPDLKSKVRKALTLHLLRQRGSLSSDEGFSLHPKEEGHLRTLWYKGQGHGKGHEGQRSANPFIPSPLDTDPFEDSGSEELDHNNYSDEHDFSEDFHQQDRYKSQGGQDQGQGHNLSSDPELHVREESQIDPEETQEIDHSDDHDRPKVQYSLVNSYFDNSYSLSKLQEMECSTPTKSKGHCSTFRACVPSLFTEDGELQAPALADLVSMTIGYCSSTLGKSEEEDPLNLLTRTMVSRFASVANRIICCPGSPHADKEESLNLLANGQGQALPSPVPVKVKGQADSDQGYPPPLIPRDPEKVTSDLKGPLVEESVETDAEVWISAEEISKANASAGNANAIIPIQDLVPPEKLQEFQFKLQSNKVQLKPIISQHAPLSQEKLQALKDMVKVDVKGQSEEVKGQNEEFKGQSQNEDVTDQDQNQDNNLVPPEAHPEETSDSEPSTSIPEHDPNPATFDLDLDLDVTSQGPPRVSEITIRPPTATTQSSPELEPNSTIIKLSPEPVSGANGKFNLTVVQVQAGTSSPRPPPNPAHQTILAETTVNIIKTEANIESNQVLLKRPTPTPINPEDSEQEAEISYSNPEEQEHTVQDDELESELEASTQQSYNYIYNERLQPQTSTSTSENPTTFHYLPEEMTTVHPYQDQPPEPEQLEVENSLSGTGFEGSESGSGSHQSQRPAPEQLEVENSLAGFEGSGGGSQSDHGQGGSGNDHGPVSGGSDHRPDQTHSYDDINLNLNVGTSTPGPETDDSQSSYSSSPSPPSSTLISIIVTDSERQSVSDYFGHPSQNVVLPNKAQNSNNLPEQELPKLPDPEPEQHDIAEQNSPPSTSGSIPLPETEPETTTLPYNEEETTYPPPKPFFTPQEIGSLYKPGYHSNEDASSSTSGKAKNKNKNPIKFKTGTATPTIPTPTTTAKPSTSSTGNKPAGVEVGGVTPSEYQILSACATQDYYRSLEQESFRQYPYLATIVGGSRPFCSGTLITDRHILTASHFLSNITVSDVFHMRVHVGYRSAFGGQTEGPFAVRKVLKVIRHKGFSFDKLLNDVAILLLDRPVRFSEQIHPICLSTAPPSVHSLSEAFETGWVEDPLMKKISPHHPFVDPHILKYFTFGYKNVTWTLQQSSTRIKSQEDCQSSYSFLEKSGIYITDSMICASTEDSKSCAFKGNSGAPLFINRDGRVIQAGLVSWGIGCGHFPAVFTGVSSYLPWIEKVVQRTR